MIRFAHHSQALLAAGLLLAATGAAAQSPAPPARCRLLPPQAQPALLGGRIGYGRFQLRGSEVDYRTAPAGGAAANEPLAGLTLGLVVRARLAGPLAFETELGYVRKGGRLTGSGLTGNTAFTVDYLQIPALLHLSLLQAGRLSLAAEAGYAANLAMSGPAINYQALAPGTDIRQHGVVLAPALGAEVAWQQANRRYFLHARYTRDQSYFLRRTFDGQNYELYHQGITMTIGALVGFD